MTNCNLLFQSYILPRLSVCYENLKLKDKAKLALLLDAVVQFKVLQTKPMKDNKSFVQDKWAMLQNEDNEVVHIDHVTN